MNDEVDVDSPESEETQTEQPVPRGKRLTPEKTFQRIWSMGILKLALLCFIVGIILSALWAIALYNWYSDPSDDISWFMRHGAHVIDIFYYLLALVSAFVAASIAYRLRYYEDESGEAEKRGLDFPDEGIEGKMGSISSISILVFCILMIIALITVIIGFYTSGEEFEFRDHYKLVYFNNLLISIVYPLIPLTLLFIFLSNPRGLKRLDLNISLITIAMVGAVITFIVIVIRITEYHMFYSDLFNMDLEDFMGGSQPREVSGFSEKYALPLSNIMMAVVFGFSGFIISNLKLKRKNCFKFQLTPGAIIIILGMVMFLINALLLLTVLKPDYNITEEAGYYSWSIFLSVAGLFVLLGGLLVLMIEYSLARKIMEEDVSMPFGMLWQELKEENPFFNRIFGYEE